jgi:hypothetical protein
MARIERKKKASVLMAWSSVLVRFCQRRRRLMRRAKTSAS